MDDIKNADDKTDKKKNSSKLLSKEAVFFTTVTGVSLLSGFGYTLSTAKKKDPSFFNQGLVGAGSTESGGRLALRALGFGSLYAVTGVSLLCYGVWKLMGVHNMTEFRDKIRSVAPRNIRREPQGRQDFETVQELVDYIITDGAENKKK